VCVHLSINIWAADDDTENNNQSNDGESSIGKVSLYPDRVAKRKIGVVDKEPDATHDE